MHVSASAGSPVEAAVSPGAAAAYMRSARVATRPTATAAQVPFRFLIMGIPPFRDRDPGGRFLATGG
jgi:hypothetical protein